MNNLIKNYSGVVIVAALTCIAVLIPVFFFGFTYICELIVMSSTVMTMLGITFGILFTTAVFYFVLVLTNILIEAVSIRYLK